MTKTRHHFEQLTEDYPPKFLMLCLDGRRHECATAEEVGTFMWGRDIKEWFVYRLVPIADIDEITRLLETGK